MIRGVIFDMDGVLVDNASFHIRAWQQLGRENGRRLTEEAVKEVFGRRSREMLAALLGRDFAAEEAARLSKRKEAIYRELMTPALKPMPGLIDFLAEVRDAGLKVAVATSGPQENLELVLNALGIQSQFDSVITGADVSRSKPDPEVFLLAARRLGLRAPECVVFEDSLSGIEAARRAACPCIALATTHTPIELEGHGTARIISDFTEMTAGALASL